MTDHIDELGKKILDWVLTTDPDARCALLLQPEELAILCMALELHRDICVKMDSKPTSLEILDRIAEKVLDLLRQGGYKGQESPQEPRPPADPHPSERLEP